MAPAHEAVAALEARSYCSSGSYYSNGFCYRNSNWYGWGRWVLLGVIVFVFFLFLLFMSRRVRRQRRTGTRPMYGTSWMGGWGQHQQPQYNNAQNYSAPPPQYSQQASGNPQYTGGTYNSNQGYYGQNTGTYNNDVPLQQPSNTYYPTREADNDYAAPEGPPPSKR
ncbi:hypothetical protein SPBR_01040 [Sporothrix brasiliensis 5110]|uniref:Chitin synthesis regulation, Congo red resistance, RCR protein n=1 Tax=Sporothrix brasiliensis 5110 TaxID=1398154 RepID=A0A0C2IMZ4_9PEZI|nr:uncharacterized protein SPBR_01040 [Sporothrix brasiliensis 5110]KIH90401.1 hypothetical protein SPBR_01040 [Sporothrix brasiliensis 5110]